MNDSGRSLYKRKASQLSIHFDKEGIPVRLTQIQRKMLVAEPSIRAQFKTEKLAEVVNI